MEENNSEVKPKVGLNILQKISDDNPKIDSKIVKKILLSFSKMVDEEFLSNETKKRAKLFAKISKEISLSSISIIK